MCLKRRATTYNERRSFNVQLNERDPKAVSPYPSNFIKTSRYSAIDFLPLSLLFQFKRYANIYFLIIAVLQSISIISPLSPLSAIAPLVFVLAVSMVREGVEDYYRHQSDNKVNSEETVRLVMKNGQIVEEKLTWADVEVGDLLKVGKDKPFPADLIALESVYPNGVCYIETGALDGEKNMKPKSCLKETYSLFKQGKMANIAGIKMNAEQPNQQLYSFNGTFEGLFEVEMKPEQQKNNKAQVKQSNSMQAIRDEVDRLVNDGEQIRNFHDQQNGAADINNYRSNRPDQKQQQNQNQPFQQQLNHMSTNQQQQQQPQQNGQQQNQSHTPAGQVLSQPMQYSQQTILISAKQLLLRGAFLRNTDYIIGMVVYTGLDSKIMRNSEEAKQKTSDMENRMNFYIICILGMQLICSLMTAIIGWIWNSNYLDGHFYLKDDDYDYSNGVLAILTFFTYFLLYNTMIPISLIVSLEMVKVAQGYFISKDALMYCPSKDIWPKVMTTTINEELGQVEYVFSDKTGTLTCNVMEFNKSVIGHVLYGDSGVPNPKLAQKKQIEEYDEVTGQPKKKKPSEEEEFKFYDPHLDELLSQNLHDSLVDLTISSEDNKVAVTFHTQRDLVCEYWKLLSTAHECIIDRDKETGWIRYQGPSPDEITLVDAARHMGFVFEGSSSDTIDVNIRGIRQKVKMHNSFEFNSDRKRMSVIVQEGNVYKLYIKGADSIIKSRLSQSKPQPFLEKTNEYLTQFSLIGLRTLMMAVRILSEAEFLDFKTKLTSLSDSPEREKETAKLVDQLERNLTLIGATAVEDKLQERVPETIYDLIKANIKVWMLTGDKLETAENIAKSCRLIQSDMHVIQVSETNEQLLKNNLLGTAMDTFEKLKENRAKKSLLVEGESLRMIFEDQNLQQAFLKISKDCESVVCCRVTPKQKALVVRLIKENLKKITLAIGDGANDVNMIQEAHIGCGIFGNEGMQAAQSSDFAFGEFKCLWRLVLVHGRWSYIRISEMIIYFFYKNMLFTIPQLYFAFFCAYSGQTIFDSWFISLYNLVFTALPLISRAVLDQDINYKVTVEQVQMGEEDNRIQKIIEKKEKYLEKKYPTFYYTSQDKTIFTDRNFISWVFQGLIHGLIIFFATYLSFESITFSDEGLSTDLWNFSLIIFSSIIFVANLKIALYTRYWTWLTFVAFGVTSFLLYFGFLLLSEVIESSQVYLTPFQMLQHCQFYLIVFFCSGLVLTFDMTVFISAQFLQKQRILPLMRLLKTPQTQLERRPSWADEMSVFDSFYKITPSGERVSRSGSLYGQANGNEKADIQAIGGPGGQNSKDKQTPQGQMIEMQKYQDVRQVSPLRQDNNNNINHYNNHNNAGSVYQQQSNQQYAKKSYQEKKNILLSGADEPQPVNISQVVYEPIRTIPPSADQSMVYNKYDRNSYTNFNNNNTYMNHGGSSAIQLEVQSKDSHQNQNLLDDSIMKSPQPMIDNHERKRQS